MRRDHGHDEEQSAESEAHGGAAATLGGDALAVGLLEPLVARALRGAHGGEGLGKYRFRQNFRY